MTKGKERTVGAETRLPKRPGRRVDKATLASWKEVGVFARVLAVALRESLARRTPFDPSSYSFEETAGDFTVLDGGQQLRFSGDRIGITRIMEPVPSLFPYAHNPQPWFQDFTSYAETSWRDQILCDFIRFAGTHQRDSNWLDPEFALVAASLGRKALVMSAHRLYTFVRVEGKLDEIPFRIELDEKIVVRGIPGPLRDHVREELMRLTATR